MILQGRWQSKAPVYQRLVRICQSYLSILRTDPQTKPLSERLGYNHAEFSSVDNIVDLNLTSTAFEVRGGEAEDITFV